jgi:hypothetical protein
MESLEIIILEDKLINDRIRRYWRAHMVAYLVEALGYKLEGRGFKSR